MWWIIPDMAMLVETTLSEGVLNVDEDEGVIRRVKILGSRSKNGRTYSDRAMRDACALYEGVKVNVDHPEKDRPNAERSFSDGIGELRECRISDGAVFGDLHYLKSHHQAAPMVEHAKRFPKQFGLSHNAEGELIQRDGEWVVESVSEVRSVDLVGRPATNEGLFESEEGDDQMPKMKTRSVEEILSGSPDGKLKRKLASLVEMEAVPAEMPVETPEEADPAAEVKAALEKAAVAVLKKLFSGDLDEAAAFAEIKKIIGMADATGGEGEGGDEAAAPVPESVRKLQAEMNEIRAKNLLLESDREATPERVQAVASIPQAGRTKLVESWPKRDGGDYQSSRPQSSRPMFESGGGDEGGSYEDLRKNAFPSRSV